MKTKLYTILNASLFLLLIAAANPTLAQNNLNNAARLPLGAERNEHRAAPSTMMRAKTETAVENLTDGVGPDAAGDLDPAFGTGGKVITDLPDDNFTRQVEIQANGKIVVLGWARDLASNLLGTYLVRYNANGSLDTGFGASGTVRVDCSDDCFEDGFVTLPDGKLLVIGDSFDATNGVKNFGIFRLNTDGTRDMTWGVNGVVKIPIGSGSSYGHEIVLQPDGKIVVFGVTQRGSFNDFDLAVARLHSNGTLDASFGTNGVLTTPVLNNTGFARIPEVKLQPDGKFLFLVQANSIIGAGRINANGTLDTAFGTNGFLALNTASGFDVRALALQPDGKFIIVTRVFDNNQAQSTVIRYNANATPDSSFGTNGTVVTSLADDFRGFAVVIQPNGKIVVGGQRNTGSLRQFALLRVNPTGAIDTGFGANGFVATTLRGVNDYIKTMALQPDGKLVALGDVAVTLSDPYDIGLARYNLDAPRPTQFDFDGDARTDLSVFRPNSGVWYSLNSGNNSFSAAQWGVATDKIVPADYDGDRKSDLAIYRNGVWYVLQSSNNAFRQIQFGIAGDIPVSGDYDGDGKADLAVFRTGIWYVLNSADNSFRAEQFGIATDKPIVGDFDGDLKQDLAVYRDGTWYVKRSAQGYYAAQFGVSSDKPVAADYDGDGRTDLAVYRSGTWYLLKSTGGFSTVQFGVASDKPVVADYDGDFKADVAVYRDGNWFILNSTNNAFRSAQFGLPSDLPIPAAYLP